MRVTATIVVDLTAEQIATLVPGAPEVMPFDPIMLHMTARRDEASEGITLRNVEVIGATISE